MYSKAFIKLLYSYFLTNHDMTSLFLNIIHIKMDFRGQRKIQVAKNWICITV